jgi:alpha-L-fucosidase
MHDVKTGPAVHPSRAAADDLEWWQDARVGLFIHFGVASVVGVDLSWGRALPRPFDVQSQVHHPGEEPQSVPHEVYDDLFRRFDPARFDAREWVAAAQRLGAGYIVMTAKHHDGFCLWDTSLTDYKLTSAESPFGRDLIRELADACHDQGMPLGLYYSQRDWHHPDYLQGDNQAYQRYMDGQLAELLSDYGRIHILWFDSYGESDLEQEWDPASTIALARELQPGILINNRLAILDRYNQGPPEYWGDFDTPEQRLGDVQFDRPWESCITLDRLQWGWRADGELLTVAECIRSVVTCATRGGNLLLNVGPDPAGVIEEHVIDRLGEVGDWLRLYGESVYGTRGVPLGDTPWGGVTQNADAFFVHVLDWPAEGIRIPLDLGDVPDADVLTGGRVTIEPSEDDCRIEVPEPDRDSVDTIIRIPRSGRRSLQTEGDQE